MSALSKGEGARMTQMAVEACTASLVLTGFVHADPHEGNLMLDSEGRIVFMDFGLMSRVDDSVMGRHRPSDSEVAIFAFFRLWIVLRLG